MFFYFIAIFTILKTFSPYMRKHIIDDLNAHEYLILNTAVVFLIVSVFLFYKIMFSKETVTRIVSKYKQLTTVQILCVLTISLMTVISAIMVVNLEKYMSNTVVSSTLMKTASTALLVLTGYFIFEEKYTSLQLVGVFLAVIGGILMII